MKKKKHIKTVNKRSDAEKDTYHAFGLCFVIIFIMFIIPFSIAVSLVKVYAGFDISWYQIGALSSVFWLGLVFLCIK